VRRYTAEDDGEDRGVVGAAIQALSPASLSFEQGLAGIAVNRRRVGRRWLPGPVDHDVPVAGGAGSGGRAASRHGGVRDPCHDAQRLPDQ